MQRSVAEGTRIELERVECAIDGLKVKRVGEKTLAIVSRMVDDIVTLPDEEIFAALLWTLARTKVVVEGAAAAPVAALLNGLVEAPRGSEGRRRAQRRQPRPRTAPRPDLELGRGVEAPPARRRHRHEGSERPRAARVTFGAKCAENGYRNLTGRSRGDRSAGLSQAERRDVMIAHRLRPAVTCTECGAADARVRRAGARSSSAATTATTSRSSSSARTAPSGRQARPEPFHPFGQCARRPRRFTISVRKPRRVALKPH